MLAIAVHGRAAWCLQCNRKSSRVPSAGTTRWMQCHQQTQAGGCNAIMLVSISDVSNTVESGDNSETGRVLGDHGRRWPRGNGDQLAGSPTFQSNPTKRAWCHGSAVMQILALRPTRWRRCGQSKTHVPALARAIGPRIPRFPPHSTSSHGLSNHLHMKANEEKMFCWSPRL